MSRPRAATSVATRSSSVPARNFFITRSRCSCDIPPCIASTRNPRPFRLSVRSSTSRRVRQKTSAPAGLSRSRIRPSAARLWPRATTYAVCRTLGIVHAALQGPELRLHRRAPVNGEDADADLPAVPVNGLGELHRELAGRYEDEDRGRDSSFGLRSDAVEDRERERGGLPGARRRLRENVAPFEERRDRRALDGRGLLVAQGGERAHEAPVEAEGREGRRRDLVHGPILRPAQRTLSKTPETRSFRTSSQANQRPFIAT